MNKKMIILKDLYSRLGTKLTKDQYYGLCQIEDDEAILAQLDHKKQVQYALKCACSVVHLINNPKQAKATQDCLSLAAKWLDHPSKVTEEQLSDAAHAGYAAAYVAADYAAAYAVDAAAYAVDAAAYAVDAAAYAVIAASDKQAQEELNFSFLMSQL